MPHRRESARQRNSRSGPRQISWRTLPFSKSVSPVTRAHALNQPAAVWSGCRTSRKTSANCFASAGAPQACDTIFRTVEVNSIMAPIGFALSQQGALELVRARSPTGKAACHQFSSDFEKAAPLEREWTEK